MQPRKRNLTPICLVMVIVLALCSAALATKPLSAQHLRAGGPDIITLTGPVALDTSLRDLPAASATTLSRPFLERQPHSAVPVARNEPAAGSHTDSPLGASLMPSATFSVEGVMSATSTCDCIPPDPDGDVGPANYVQAVNQAIQVRDKQGNALAAPVSFNSLFAALGPGTACGNNLNSGDGIVFYDQQADRWIIADQAGQSPEQRCLAVSKTGDPLNGGYWLYAFVHDPAHPDYLGDFAKFGVWSDAYYMTVNLFDDSLQFIGVRAYALNRSALINGTAAPTPTVLAFTVPPAGLGDAYDLLPATYRFGGPPPGRNEFFAAIDAPITAGLTISTVHLWRFHTDFGVPANSTFGVGPDHAPDANITVTPFVNAAQSFPAYGNIIPQPGTAIKLDSLGDHLDMNLWYQNLGGAESLWAVHTVNAVGPTGLRWYQVNVSGNTIASVPLQQQTFTNNADGFYRWNPSLAVDAGGNMAIGYNVSSASVEPAIRFAGRRKGDPPNTLAQGESNMTSGGGHQTGNSRWGDYSAMSIDPVDFCTFWYTQQYYPATSARNWHTRIGTFHFAAADCADRLSRLWVPLLAR